MTPVFDDFFDLSTPINSADGRNIIKAVNQGIDARLTGFTRSTFTVSGYRLYCRFHWTELEVLLRRLLELGTESAENLADDIVYSYYGVEVWG